MKKVFVFFLVCFFLVCFSFAGVAGFIIYQVYKTDDAQFNKENIINILSKDTLLFYADGQTQLGSLFGQEHRIYISIARIPKVLKDAIVSAEDEDFYTNIGIDPKGILRASIHNLLSHSRQGASTITQQTVKNLFGRKETNLQTKFQEMVNAFKLERMYSKSQILEFYLNQVHITGNGRGVGVAAKYYFNKDVEDLDLVEAAFIAGSVKGPEKYNPFTKNTIEGQKKSRREAFIRKNYVIERMLKNDKITKEQYIAALKKLVPFNQGRFQFNELDVNQIVMKQMSRKEILDAVGADSIQDVASMGLHVTTTLVQSTQVAAQYGLRQNLSRLQTKLDGFSLEHKSLFKPIQKLEQYGFYVGYLQEIDSKKDKQKMIVNFGVPSCTVDTEAINRMALFTDFVRQRGLEKARDEFMNRLAPGSYVLVSIRNTDQNQNIYCDLETRPKVQGAALVLDKGKILAMAGGFATNEYNRAIFAKRQPGSTFKLPVYYAAQQLGWTVLDPLSNMRDVFLWQGNFYFPRSDHTPKTLETTILGAGALSENLASVWLLEHLMDKLTYTQYLELLQFLKILDNNNTTQALKLIVDKFNVSPEQQNQIKEGILNHIKSDFTTDLSIMTNHRLKIFIKTLHMGYNFDQAENQVFSDKELSQKEKEIRLNILKNNLIRWTNIASQVKLALSRLHEVAEGHPITETDRMLFSSFARDSMGKNLVYKSQSPWSPNTVSHIASDPSFTRVSIDSLIGLLKSEPLLFTEDQILLDGVVPLSLIESIHNKLNQEALAVQNLGPLEKLYWNADFKYSLGLYYTANMIKNMGVNGEVQWIPSLALGSNVLTLAELSLMYQTFLTGKIYRYFDEGDSNQLAIVKRIEDLNGNLLWEAHAKETQFADEFYSPAMLNTLRGTVVAGTAFHGLNWSVILSSLNEGEDSILKNSKIRVPSFGKTGSTNNNVNGSYVGFLPYLEEGSEEFSGNNAYTIATYVGYDNNKPMVRPGFRVYGAESLPAWREVALSIIKNENFAKKLDWKTLIEHKLHLLPFHYGNDLISVVVPIHSGVSLEAQEPNDDEESKKTSNVYANDFSETGQKVFHVFLKGEISHQTFEPKRKISFFNNIKNSILNGPLDKKIEEEGSSSREDENVDQENIFPLPPSPFDSQTKK